MADVIADSGVALPGSPAKRQRWRYANCILTCRLALRRSVGTSWCAFGPRLRRLSGASQIEMVVSLLAFCCIGGTIPGSVYGWPKNVLHCPYKMTASIVAGAL